MAPFLHTATAEPGKSAFLRIAVLMLPVLLAVGGGAEARPAGSDAEALRKFKVWFKQYKRGDIDLYQRSIVPVTPGARGGSGHHDSTNVEAMDALMAELVKAGTVDAARLLVEAATFRFDRRGDVEADKFFRKQPWVMRSRAVDALGRFTGEEAREWLKKNLLESTSLWDSAYRRSLGARIFGLDAAELDRILPAVDDRDPCVRETALESLARLGSADHLETVYARLGDDAESVRCAAVEAAGGIVERNRDERPEIFFESLDRITALLDDPSWSVQDSVLTYLEEFRAIKSIPVLIDFLARMEAKIAAGKGGRARTLHRTVEVLQSLTAVTSPGSDAASWKQWWKENKDYFELPPETSMRRGYQTGTAQFFSIPVHSDRVVFILDMSGSMKAPLKPGSNDPGESKLERARQELERTLEDLGAEVRFNILLFNDDIKRFTKTFEPAHIANVLQAKIFFRNIGAEGGTNLFDALNAALALQEIGINDSMGDDVECDTVFLLSDGVPSTGLVIDPREIVDIISRANHTKRIRIHTIYIGADPSPFMQDLAEKNYGRYVHVK